MNVTRCALFIALLSANAFAQAQITPRPFDKRMAADLAAYVEPLMEREGMPGVSIAIVQNGKIVYRQGFGVRELGKAGAVTPETLMMIGSTGKSMTTMMMASLVDDGKIRWDTPAAQIDPDFAVSDSTLTSKITLRDTVCNCTGIQRHDPEMSFASAPTTPEAVIASLRDFGFSGTFRRTFGYVNQMVASGGYIAAWADHAPGSNLYSNYLAQMQKRVFGPIGMKSTTFSFDRVLATADHAIPHGQLASGEYVPGSIDAERSLIPFAPAGASWSNADDLARYLITQLHRGVAPDGRRLASEENLTTTWKPQVDVAPGAAYALGWGVGNYKGQRLLSHGGGTSGFSTDLTFLPDAAIGIAVLMNSQNSNLAGAAIRWRAIELLFGQPKEKDAILSAKMAEDSRRFKETMASVHPVDAAAVAAFVGDYTNPALGNARVTLKDHKLFLDSGSIVAELRSLSGQAYVIWNSVLATAVVRLSHDAKGNPILVLDPNDPEEPWTYTFTKKDRADTGQ
ncbi:MAG: serine hydrolase domain-containing protein [Thermoanaerobaculia bacterium]